MKRLVTLILLFTLSLAIAVTAEQNEMLSVKQLIQKVKNSTGDERRIAMNALKIKLRSVNQETRRQAILDLQKSFSKKQHGTQGRMQQNARAQRAIERSGTTHPGTSQRVPHISPSAVPHQPTPSAPHTQPPGQQRPLHNAPPHTRPPGGRN